MENSLDKTNFLNWYCWYATQEEIEKAKQTNRGTINRLMNEYSYEIEKITTAKHFNDSLLLPKGTIPEFYPLNSS
ncbi:MAG: hypothetical protein K8F52_00920 [Candidatus Scalindua rubra]|uniref:Uncharacterized protein n=1 Tax=Candidatus Scalindua brodae TaxID=237368 RepID=A0A0B0EFR6_9BACT|nr:MAG: hypothetical protein SCABRO_02311 [Candidatus Scalindua brodae]MBZ0107202.1 hypothetical protein [Candidatus Scalindua rubra]TWU31640.1 hypothetical protein S225a_20310 [Candidatus Brocadiaceae bacterium S225]